MSTSTKPQPPRTAAEINKRRQEIGAELAKGRIVPVPNAKQLEAEDNRLRAEYLEALNRESQAKTDAEAIRVRVEAARQSAAATEREKRIAGAVAEELAR